MKKYIGLIAGFLPIAVSAQLVMTNNYYVVLSGGSQSSPATLVLTNPSPSAITNSGSGWIVSENEFNQVVWNIGTNTGNYIVPFGYGTSDYLPVTCNISAAGVGNGSIKFSTYHGPTWDNSAYVPSDVTNMTDFGRTDYSNDAVDRFWILDANGYSTMPTPDITFTYIRDGAFSEIAAPNNITESAFIAQRFNSSLNEWYDWLGATGTNITSVNTGTIKSGNVPPAFFYRSWCLFNDSALFTGIPSLSNHSSIDVFPNPTPGNITISGITPGQVIELYDYIGQKLSSDIADNSIMHFDVSDKPYGVYLIRIENKDGTMVAEKKVMKTQ
ncbi:MAG: T9SS type A sorting domain-containing protein [Bacteroidia bacterium]